MNGAATARYKQLGLDVLRLTRGDVLVVRFRDWQRYTPRDADALRQALAAYLDETRGFHPLILCIPDGFDLTAVPPATMRALGWVPAAEGQKGEE